MQRNIILPCGIPLQMHDRCTVHILCKVSKSYRGNTMIGLQQHTFSCSKFLSAIIFKCCSNVRLLIFSSPSCCRSSVITIRLSASLVIYIEYLFCEIMHYIQCKIEHTFGLRSVHYESMIITMQVDKNSPFYVDVCTPTHMDVDIYIIFA